MNFNKKLDRLKQWTGERIGGGEKTGASEDFVALEKEMAMRYEVMKQNHTAMSEYVRNISKRIEVEDKEKLMPVAYVGAAMATYGHDLEHDSELARSLVAFGRANERIGSIQDSYVGSSTTSWLESVERSIAQMKEYQAARKKLESRRLAYDAALTKLQKAKKEDFKMEEELRAQKAKYEESNEDVYRRMQDIRESEVDSVQDLTAFVEAELDYHRKCTEVLTNLKREWPAGNTSATGARSGRSRSNTAHSFTDRYSQVPEESEMPPPQPQRPNIAAFRGASASVPQSPARELPGFDLNPSRPVYQRANTGEISSRNEFEPPIVGAQRMTRVGSDSLSIRAQRAQLKPLTRYQSNNDVLDDHHIQSPTIYSNSTTSGSDRYDDRLPPSPSTSVASSGNRSFSSGALTTLDGNVKKAPPPPPPSRAKKPPPPPPPMKRSALSTSDVQYA